MKQRITITDLPVVEGFYTGPPPTPEELERQEVYLQTQHVYPSGVCGVGSIKATEVDAYLDSLGWINRARPCPYCNKTGHDEEAAPCPKRKEHADRFVALAQTIYGGGVHGEKPPAHDHPGFPAWLLAHPDSYVCWFNDFWSSMLEVATVRVLLEYTRSFEPGLTDLELIAAAVSRGGVRRAIDPRFVQLP